MRRERADGDRARARERRAAEEADLDQWLVAAQLVADQDANATSETANRPSDLRRQPAVARRLR